MLPDSTQPTGAASTDAVDDEPRTAPHAEPAHQVVTASDRKRLARFAQPPAPQLRVRHRAGGRGALGPRQRRPRVVGIRRLGLRPQEPRAGRRRRLTVGVVAPAGDRAVVGAKSAGMPDAAAHRRETLPRRWPVRQIPPADRGSVHLETAGVTAAAADGPKPLVRRRVTRQIGTFRIAAPTERKPHGAAIWASGGASQPPNARARLRSQADEPPRGPARVPASLLMAVKTSPSGAAVWPKPTWPAFSVWSSRRAPQQRRHRRHAGRTCGSRHC